MYQPVRDGIDIWLTHCEIETTDTQRQTNDKAAIILIIILMLYT